jgi:hypothetical protein
MMMIGATLRSVSKSKNVVPHKTKKCNERKEERKFKFSFSCTYLLGLQELPRLIHLGHGNILLGDLALVSLLLGGEAVEDALAAVVDL